MNGYASLARVEFDDLNKDLVILMDLRYSEHEPDSVKIPEQKENITVAWQLSTVKPSNSTFCHKHFTEFSVFQSVTV